MAPFTWLIVIAALVQTAAFEDSHIDEEEFVVPKSGAINSAVPVKDTPNGRSALGALGVAAVWKAPRCVLRGTLTAIRDILFPDRDTSVADQIDGEDQAEFALREYIRIFALQAAREHGLIELHSHNPDVVRYGFAGAFGLLFLGLFLAIQAGATACSRLTTRVILRLIGEDATLVQDQAAGMASVAQGAKSGVGCAGSPTGTSNVKGSGGGSLRRRN